MSETVGNLWAASKDFILKSLGSKGFMVLIIIYYINNARSSAQGLLNLPACLDFVADLPIGRNLHLLNFYGKNRVPGGTSEAPIKIGRFEILFDCLQQLSSASHFSVHTW